MFKKAQLPGAPAPAPAPPPAPLAPADRNSAMAADKLLNAMLLAGGGAALTRTLLGLHERLKTPAFRERAKMPRKSVIELPYLAKGARSEPMNIYALQRYLAAAPAEERQEILQYLGNDDVDGESVYQPGLGEQVGRGLGTVAGAGLGALGGMATGSVGLGLASGLPPAFAVANASPNTLAGLLGLGGGMGGYAGGRLGGSTGGALGAGLDRLFGHPATIKHTLGYGWQGDKEAAEKRAYRPGGGRNINPADSMRRLHAGGAPSTNPASAVGGVQYSSPAVAAQVQKNLATNRRMGVGQAAPAGPAYTPGQASFASKGYSGYGGGGPSASPMSGADFARNPGLGTPPRVAQLAAGARSAGNLAAAQGMSGIGQADRMAGRMRQVTAPMGEMERQNIAGNFGGRAYMQPKGLPGGGGGSPAQMARQMAGPSGLLGPGGPKPPAGLAGPSGPKPPAPLAGPGGGLPPIGPQAGLRSSGGGPLPFGGRSTSPLGAGPKLAAAGEPSWLGQQLGKGVNAVMPPQGSWLNPDTPNWYDKPWTWMAAIPALAGAAHLGWGPVDSAFKGMRKADDEAELDDARRRYEEALHAQVLAKAGSEGEAGLDALYEAHEKRGFPDLGEYGAPLLGAGLGAGAGLLGASMTRPEEADEEEQHRRRMLALLGGGVAGGLGGLAYNHFAGGQQAPAPPAEPPSPLDLAHQHFSSRYSLPGHDPGRLFGGGEAPELPASSFAAPDVQGPPGVPHMDPLASPGRPVMPGGKAAAEKKAEGFLTSNFPFGDYGALMALLFSGTALGTGSWAYNNAAQGNSRKVLDEALKRRQQQLYTQTPRPFVVKPVALSAPKPTDVDDGAGEDEADADALSGGPLAATRR